MLESSQDWFFLVTLIVGLTAFTSWLAFGRLTMARIDRAIKRSGLPRPCQWDGPGARIILYAYAVALPSRLSNRIDTRLVDASVIRRFSRPSDRLGGLILVASSTSLGLLCIAGGLLLDF